MTRCPSTMQGGSRCHGGPHRLWRTVTIREKDNGGLELSESWIEIFMRRPIVGMHIVAFVFECICWIDVVLWY